ncbi:MAG: hypothetical protein D6726_12255, partial [Nitrospirae bacterium]
MMKRYCLITVFVLAGYFIFTGAAFGTEIFVNNRDASTVSVINPDEGKKIHTITVGKKSTYIALSPDGRYAFSVSTAERQLYVIDAERFRVIRTLPLSDAPKGVGVTPDGRFVYVVNEGKNASNVYVFETGRWKRVNVIKVGSLPHNI